MDSVQLTLTAALLCLTKTAAAAGAAKAAGEELSVNEAERFGEQEAASTTDGQDPLGLKQSVFIVTPIVMVRKRNTIGHILNSDLCLQNRVVEVLKLMLIEANAMKKFTVH